MKISFILVTLVLAGCAGLNVQWAATATYNTPATTSAIMTPGIPAVAASGAASGAKP